MSRRLAQQRMTLSDIECLKSTSIAFRAISAIAELVVFTAWRMYMYLQPTAWLPRIW